MLKFLSFCLRIPIKIYQWLLSPLFPNSCRYTPTCSHYSIEAIDEWGPFKGLWLGIKRVSRCHPWGDSGFDPVPPKENK
ncbi:MAG: membrane protein insertion efficiency factor YidD [Candidatus Marinimicrobia bacterium]|nr:membrane protein insertion efficiency factor YidD [Candidatus Neomarinimicrobiota bacterium]MBT3946852.1 membrane protein insertion efficiency factor YidD [Candidatus Neomarinimicrobiota bacterium]MBT4065356.1 membrane protein insertion efficiency factor YidD [Candidatus Neomarinimicrobiota bacterium]MBT4454271.1 membrane protein insertion efficiency factor YidD [Candidatus Neomarinimicrobiota bacterium]MBT4736885.1 membrane protein insertion efficiency factor YidD [Candidatus Neomarinimicro